MYDLNISMETLKNLEHNFSLFSSNLSGVDEDLGESRADSEEKPLSLGFGFSNDPETRRIIHYGMAVYVAVVGILGVIGNGLVLIVFTRYQRLRSGGGPLILSLATADLILSILHILPAYSSVKERWAFGKLGCDLYAGAVGLGGLASLITLSAIAVDRFFVIIGRPVTCIAKKITCFCIWCLTLLLVLPPFFGWSKFVPEGMGTSCSWDYSTQTLSNRLYYVFLLILGFCIPVTIIIISYVGILIVVCQHSRALRGLSINGVMSGTRLSKTDIRTTQVVLTLVLCFLISWTPYAIVSLIGQFGEPGTLTQLGTSLPALFAKGAVIYNPIIYGLSHPNFRSAVMSVFTKNTSNRNLTQNLCYQNSPRYGQSSIQLQVIPNSRNSLMIGQLGTKRNSIGTTTSSTLTAKMRRESAKPLIKINHEPFRNGLRSRQNLVNTQGNNNRNYGVNTRNQHNGKSELLEIARRHSSLMNKFNYSAPDLRRDGRIVRNPNLMSLSEYRRRKRKWQWKVLFRSEDCLTELLQSTAFHSMAKLANRDEILGRENSKKAVNPPQKYNRHSPRHHSPKHHSPRHLPHQPVGGRESITVNRPTCSARSSLSVPTTGRPRNNTRRHTEPKIDEENRKKSTTSILHKANHSKRDSNLLALPLRFEDGISSGDEEADTQQNTPSPTRRSSSGRKSSSSGSKGSGAVGRKNILEFFTWQSWMRRKSSNYSEATGVSHYTSSQRSGSHSKKFSFESSIMRHE